jgi:hypothetical protein
VSTPLRRGPVVREPDELGDRSRRSEMDFVARFLGRRIKDLARLKAILESGHS